MTKLISNEDNIFVAGARGMVGSSITRQLHKAGYGNNRSKGRLLAPSREELDLSNNNNVKEWFKEKKPAVVILAAAKVGGIFANSDKPTDFLLENLKIQNNIIENAWKYGARRLLFLGSSCIYPKFCSQPIKEEYLLTGELEPTNQWYAIAKIAGIKLCQALRTEYGFDAISLMPTNLYGPGDNYHPQNSHVLPALINRFYKAKENAVKKVTCWGTGSALREFLHVDDLGEACIYALENWDPSDKSSPKDHNGNELNFLNVGSGKDISIKELAHIVASTVGYKGEILWDKNKPDGTPKKQLNVEKFSQVGWNSKISLREGIKNTYEIFIKDKKLKKLRSY